MTAAAASRVAASTQADSSSLLRHPTKDPQHADPEAIELVAPVFGPQDVDPLEADLTVQHNGEPGTAADAVRAMTRVLVLHGRLPDATARRLQQICAEWADRA